MSFDDFAITVLHRPTTVHLSGLYDAS
jgi:hypothetical protein